MRRPKKQTRETKTLPDYASDPVKDYLPGMVKPLVYSVHSRIIGNAWQYMTKSLTGGKNLSQDIPVDCICYRFYLKVGRIGSFIKRLGFQDDLMDGILGKSDELILKPTLRILRNLPRIFMFYIRFKKRQHKLDSFLIAYEERIRLYIKLIESVRNEWSLLSIIDTLIDKNSSMLQFNIIERVESAFWLQRYKNALKRYGISPGQVEETCFKNVRYLYNPQFGINHYTRKSFAMRFGHFSDSGGDFSFPFWEEDPTELEKRFLSYKSVKTTRKKKLEAIIGSRKVAGMKRLAFKAGKAGYYRDKMAYYYQWGLSLCRKAFLKLGKLWVGYGFISKAADIFYLDQEEINQIADRSHSFAIKDRLQTIMQEMTASESLETPSELFDGEPVLRPEMKG